MIYVGYPCIGKSSIAGREDFIDLDSSLFNDGTEGWEERYVNVAIDLSNQGYNVFLSSHKQVRDTLKEKEISYTCVFPEMCLFDAWFDRCAERFKEHPTDKNLKALAHVARHYKEDIADLLDEPAKSKIIIKIEYYYSNKDFDLRHLLKIPARTPQDLWG